jgi:hypothetical protein
MTWESWRSYRLRRQIIYKLLDLSGKKCRHVITRRCRIVSVLDTASQIDTSEDRNEKWFPVRGFSIDELFEVSTTGATSEAKCLFLRWKIGSFLAGLRSDHKWCLLYLGGDLGEMKKFRRRGWSCFEGGLKVWKVKEGDSRADDWLMNIGLAFGRSFGDFLIFEIFKILLWPSLTSWIVYHLTHSFPGFLNRRTPFCELPWLLEKIKISQKSCSILFSTHHFQTFQSLHSHAPYRKLQTILIPPTLTSFNICPINLAASLDHRFDSMNNSSTNFFPRPSRRCVLKHLKWNNINGN